MHKCNAYHIVAQRTAKSRHRSRVDGCNGCNSEIHTCQSFRRVCAIVHLGLWAYGVRVSQTRCVLTNQPRASDGIWVAPPPPVLRTRVSLDMDVQTINRCTVNHNWTQLIMAAILTLNNNPKLRPVTIMHIREHHHDMNQRLRKTPWNYMYHKQKTRSPFHT